MTINCEGMHSIAPSSDRVMVFEGYFNFLSWMQLNKQTTPPCDVCVLNSTTNAKHATEYISKHEWAEAYLDNDQTERECLQNREGYTRTKMARRIPYLSVSIRKQTASLPSILSMQLFQMKVV